MNVSHSSVTASLLISIGLLLVAAIAPSNSRAGWNVWGQNLCQSEYKITDKNKNGKLLFSLQFQDNGNLLITQPCPSSATNGAAAPAPSVTVTGIPTISMASSLVTQYAHNSARILERENMYLSMVVTAISLVLSSNSGITSAALTRTMANYRVKQSFTTGMLIFESNENPDDIIFVTYKQTGNQLEITISADGINITRYIDLAEGQTSALHWDAGNYVPDSTRHYKKDEDDDEDTGAAGGGCRGCLTRLCMRICRNCRSASDSDPTSGKYQDYGSTRSNSLPAFTTGTVIDALIRMEKNAAFLQEQSMPVPCLF